MPAGAVGASMHITSGSMTSVLDTLERNGFIERLTDPSDRRRVLVDVTPAAQAVLDQLLPQVVQTATAAFGGFSDGDLLDFLGILARLGEAIAATPADLGPPSARRTPSRLRRSSPERK